VVTVYDGSPGTAHAVEVAAVQAAREGQPLTVVVSARRVPPYGETVAEVREAAQRHDQDARRRTREVLARCDTAGVRPHVVLSPRRARRALAAAVRAESYRTAVVPARAAAVRLLDRVTAARLRRHTPEVIVTRAS
jgi:surfactin synthase thioesterase subunit